MTLRGHDRRERPVPRYPVCPKGKGNQLIVVLRWQSSVSRHRRVDVPLILWGGPSLGSRSPCPGGSGSRECHRAGDRKAGVRGAWLHYVPFQAEHVRPGTSVVRQAAIADNSRHPGPISDEGRRYLPACRAARPGDRRGRYPRQVISPGSRLGCDCGSEHSGDILRRPTTSLIDPGRALAHSHERRSTRPPMTRWPI